MLEYVQTAIWRHTSIYKIRRIKIFILVIDPAGLTLDWCLRCLAAGHTVKLYTKGSRAAHIGQGLVVNGLQTTYDTYIRGVNDSTLLLAIADSTYDQVIIGGSQDPASATQGAKLVINSNDALLIPVGTQGQRPSNAGFTDVAGMIRFNTTTNNIEVYDNSAWTAVGTPVFTVIADQQFNGDGTTKNFTLSQASTTAGTIVSINGVIQIPTLAYSVSSATLTFTEAPASGDVIDVRRLTTTQTVNNITSTNGYMGFNVDNNGAYVTTGTSQANNTTYWLSTGSQVSALANVSVASANTATTVDTQLGELGTALRIAAHQYSEIEAANQRLFV